MTTRVVRLDKGTETVVSQFPDNGTCCWKGGGKLAASMEKEEKGWRANVLRMGYMHSTAARRKTHYSDAPRWTPH